MAESFHDISAFQRTYQASLIVMRQVIPFLPDVGAGIRENLSCASADIPRMIASVVASSNGTHRRSPFSRALARVGDVIVLLSYCRDLHERYVNAALCEELLAMYGEARRELVALNAGAHEEG